ncbi:MAG: alpha/beta hydrolase [Sedimentisphaerales bacterium]|nr:alpha/beta hydrolase [Sedimentisphaerales bacterium]
MIPIRIYGLKPYRAAVIHGGPGAPGEMAPVARELASNCGVLEPMQSADSIAGQVAELAELLRENTETPITLIGFSWGAWLSWLTAAQHPELINKLILVSAGPFEESYAADILTTRLSRLTPKQRSQAKVMLKKLTQSEPLRNSDAFSRLGNLFSRADAYDPLPHESEVLESRGDIFNKLWPEAAHMRQTGQLLQQSVNIRCPVTAIHGDYDPHPYQGVQVPLNTALSSFKFILLPYCGHVPWLERQGRKLFFTHLKNELEFGF